MQTRDVKAGAVGAALSALAFVAVYEGKVAVSHAGERVDLAAGETAQTGEGGVKRTGDLAAGQRSWDEKAPEQPLEAANANLVDQVREYRQRLEAIARQKSSLEDKLKKTEEKLAAAESDGSAPKKRAEFDLTEDDWKELAKDGTIKYLIPCKRPPGWKMPVEALNKLGLTPQDAPVIEAAYAKSNQRQWAAIKPLCAHIVGSAEAAEKVGVNSCTHLVVDAATESSREEAPEAMRQVAEIRAGLRPMPPVDQQSPVMKVFLAATAEAKQFEADLAQSFGPEEAHRLVYAEEGLCLGRSTFGGPGPREPDKK